jgi:hypothetical protein
MGWKENLAIGVGVVGGAALAVVAAPVVLPMLGGAGLLGAAGTGTAIASLSGAAATSASLAAITGTVAGTSAVVGAGGAVVGGAAAGALSHRRKRK